MSNNSDTNLSSEDDINQIFDSIVFSENNIVSNGFKEGFSKGKTVGEFEGYHLGYHRGAELGSEIGFYKGVLEAIKSDEETQSRHQSLLEKFASLVESFPKDNNNELDLLSLRDSIRSTFKKLCSKLKIELGVPDNSNLSF